MVTAFNLWWLPWTIALSGVGLAAAWWAWRRRDVAAVVRRLGWALLPWAVLLLGLFSLVFRVVDATTDWATRFVFNPAAWLGVLLTLLALGMVGFGSRLRDRRGGSATKPLPLAARRSGSSDEDLADVEAILRKHGIS